MMKALILIFTLLSHFSLAQTYPSHWWTPVNDPNTPEWEILPQEAGPGEVILSKRNELGILSNFAATPFVFSGKEYASIEGFWQMMKFPEDENDPRSAFRLDNTREQVSLMIGHEAKKAGSLASTEMKRLQINWVSFEGHKFLYCLTIPGVHYRLIKEAMWEKLNQNAEVKKILLATGNLKLRPDHKEEGCKAPEWRYYELWMEMREQLNQSMSL